MSLETQVTALVTASENLTAVITGKLTEINAAVAQGISDVDSKIRNGTGEYTVSGSNAAGQWFDLASLGDSTVFTIYVLSTENGQVQPQEWALVLNVSGSIATATRIDNYGVLHTHSNDLFFQVDLLTKKLQVKKNLTTNRNFSIHFRVNTGSVDAVASRAFS